MASFTLSSAGCTTNARAAAEGRPQRVLFRRQMRGIVDQILEERFDTGVPRS
jgi:hypothetical protein